MAKTISNFAANQLRQAVRGDERTRRDRGGVRWDRDGGGLFACPLVITDCTTGTAGVVGVKLADGPGSGTAADGAEEESAWLGTDAFAMVDDAVWGVPIAETVDDVDLAWLILDMPKGAAHWAAPSSGDLASTQDNPSAATLCDG